MANDGLAGAAADLSGEVSRLGSAVGRLARSQRRSKRLMTGLVVSLAIDVALTILISLLFTSHREATEHIDQVQRTTTQELCLLYGLFDRAYSQQQRDTLPPERQRTYDEAFKTIRSSKIALGCTGG